MILSLDPGKLNFAYSFLTDNGKVAQTGMFNHTLTNLKDVTLLNTEILGFNTEVKKLVRKKDIVVVFERFVPRGSRYFGNLIEITCLKIGLFIGVVKASNPTAQIVPILASTWKNFFNRNHLWFDNDSVPEHVLDAIRIGQFYLLQQSRLDVKAVSAIWEEIVAHNFGWYHYKGSWYRGPRAEAHQRGKRNSFGT